MRGKTHLSIGVLSGFQAALLLHIPITLEGVFCAAICSLLPDLDEENSTISNYIITPRLNRKVREILIIILTAVCAGALAYFAYKQKHMSIKNTVLVAGVGGFASLFLFSTYIKKKSVKRILLSLVGIAVVGITYWYQFLWIFYFVGIGILIIPWLKHRGWTHTVWAIGLVYFFLKEWDQAYHSQIAWIGTASYASHLLLGDNLTSSGVKLLYPMPYTFKLPLLSTGSKWGNTVEMICVLIFLGIVLKQVL